MMGNKAIRDAFGEILLSLGEKNENIVVLDADVSGSTRTAMFGEKFPGRFYNVGVAEQNMVGIASGLSLNGYIPFISTFSFLLTMRALDQIRTSVAYPNLNVRIAGGYGGLSDSYDGPTHHSISDIAIMRALPNMKVVVTSDAVSTKKIVKNSLDWEGPVFIRLSRAEVPVIYDNNYNFTLGKGKLIEGGDDITIIANGVMVSRIIEAAEILKKDNINAQVIEMASVKPLDEKIIMESVNKTNAIMTVEEHNIIGGLGSAVAKVLAENSVGKPLTVMGIEDTYTESGDYNELLEKYGLDVNQIVDKAKKILNESV